VSERIVRASELGYYGYCHRAWWLEKVQGVEPANATELEAGTRGHAAHGRGVAFAGGLRALAALALVLALLLALVALAPWLGLG
jgi:hypothetical protein